jgi:hypothetical protein
VERRSTGRITVAEKDVKDEREDERRLDSAPSDVS